MTDVFNFLYQQPLMLLFLTIGLGSLLGKVKFGNIILGSTPSILLVGLIFSASVFAITGERFKLPNELNNIFLQLFTFAVGLKVGPQFFSGLKREGFHLVALGLITAVLNFVIVLGAAYLFKLPSGFSAGIMSGSYTITAIVGVATGVVDSGTYHPHGGLSPEQVKANIAAGYAIIYFFSTVLFILLNRYLPKMFGINPVAAGKKTEAAFGQKEGEGLPGTSTEFQLGYLPTDVRVFMIENPELDKITLEGFVRRFDTSILQVRRNNQLTKITKDLVLNLGDKISVFGTISKEISATKTIGKEIDDPKARDIHMSSAEIIVQDSQFSNKTIKEIHESATDYGLFLKAIFRQAHEMPLLPKTVLKNGDVLRVFGADASIEKAGEKLGQVLKPSYLTDMAIVAFGICFGFLIGTAAIKIGNIPIGLGVSGGVILSGILIGTLKTYSPSLGGPINEGARSLMQSIGLDVFIGVLALNVAPDLIESFKAGSVVFYVLAIGLVAGLLPALIAWLVGYYLFKMDPMILGGAVAGARCSTPGMNALQEEAKSNSPAIGYPVPYALTSMIMLIFGYLVTLMT